MANNIKTPKSEDILKVINNFKAVKPKGRFMSSKGRLDMQMPHVNRHHTCGTVHCHGGWYAIAAKLHLKGIVTYYHGAAQMAIDLGFNSVWKLKKWAHENPLIWGNKYGLSMFFYETAFMGEKRPDGAKHLSHIIQHWEEVYERVKKIEEEAGKKNKPVVYNDLTKEIAKLPVEEVSDKQKAEQSAYDNKQRTYVS